MSPHGTIKQGGIGEEPLKASTAEDVFAPKKTLFFFTFPKPAVHQSEIFSGKFF